MPPQKKCKCDKLLNKYNEDVKKYGKKKYTIKLNDYTCYIFRNESGVWMSKVDTTKNVQFTKWFEKYKGCGFESIFNKIVENEYTDQISYSKTDQFNPEFYKNHYATNDCSNYFVMTFGKILVETRKFVNIIHNHVKKNETSNMNTHENRYGRDFNCC